MFVDIQFIFNLFYIILLTQGVLAFSIVILILLDLKNASGAILVAGQSLRKMSDSVEELIDNVQAQISKILTLKGFFSFVKEMLWSKVNVSNRSEETMDSTDNDVSPKSTKAREKRRVKII
jgi:hypothetical protein